jgi:hypothetical protein
MLAHGYGPDGHRLAGRAAESMLCTDAQAEVARIGDGQSLGELGLWADQIRSNPAYADAAPWHYMNVADHASIADFEHPPEGDVLWAIGHFRARLADRSLAVAERAEALKFLVHFIVDLHQPIHVGRADDRGGNAIELRFRGQPTNLHRFWDTDVIAWVDLSQAAYVERMQAGDWAAPAAAVAAPVEAWAEESLALREQVYSFGRAGAEPPRAYLDAAADISGRRLALAAARLAATLNAVFCTE